MPGVVAIPLVLGPQLAAQAPQPVDVPTVVLAGILQGAVLLALAAWVGAMLAGPVGLRAPVVEALLSGTGVGRALRPQLLPATLAGLGTAAFIVAQSLAAPAELRAATGQVDLPLPARVLYGGITEEILMRWGAMSVLAWLPWRFLQQRAGPPRDAIIAWAIAGSALLFGVGHLPVVLALDVEPNLAVLVHVVVANTLPGILFGVLFHRRGLEAAILAHALAHVVAAPFL